MRGLITGRRRSGKTTFAKTYFSALPCVDASSKEAVLEIFKHSTNVVVCWQTDEVDGETMAKCDFFVHIPYQHRHDVALAPTDKPTGSNNSVWLYAVEREEGTRRRTTGLFRSKERAENLCRTLNESGGEKRYSVSVIETDL